MVHNRDFRRPYRPAEIVKQFVYDFDKGEVLLESQPDRNLQNRFLVTWEKLDEEWTKLNCDGALNFVSHRASCDGLLRGADGQWIRGQLVTSQNLK